MRRTHSPAWWVTEEEVESLIRRARAHLRGLLADAARDVVHRRRAQQRGDLAPVQHVRRGRPAGGHHVHALHARMHASPRVTQKGTHGTIMHSPSMHLLCIASHMEG